MKTYYMKIKEKFISEIAKGNKKHEYRLATPERMKVKVGDTFVLISNQNRRDFIKTTVKSVIHYDTWKEAIEANWQDFVNLYLNVEEALKDCYRFYSKSEVDTYGIVVYEIAPLIADYRSVNILIDTNIVIKRESGNNVSYEVAKLFNWFGKKDIVTYVHSATKEELQGYKDEKVRNVMLTKLSSYNILPQFINEKDACFDSVIANYSQDKNGKIDNALLWEVYNYNVGILLTDDSLILKKAEELYIRDRVLTSSELLSIFESTYPQNIEYKMLAVKLKTFGEVNLNSEFFDSLREDYGGKDFDDWFKKKILKKEHAYVFEDKQEGLKGFLYLKVEDEGEDYSDITPKLLPMKRLKVGTFKIESTGFRLGERFLKIIFDNAKKYDVDEIYVTLFEDKRDEVKRLKEIMEHWGFVKHGYKANGEAVLVKNLKDYDLGKSPKLNFPLIKQDASYYFLPIFPQYHTDLFPDNILKNENMHLYEDNKAHRYALEKIYLSGSYKVCAKPGDIVLLYRTGDRYPKKYSSVLTGMAVIEEIIFTKSVDECIEKCKNRSIFDENEIRYLYFEKKYTVIVKLLDCGTFKNKVKLEQLYANKIVEEGSGPRSFDIISKTQFETIYRLGMEK